jgi:hypothetical protein
MRVLTLLVVLSSLGASHLFAQYAPDTTHRCIGDVFVAMGGQAEGGGWISLQEIRDGAPGSVLLDRDLSDHDHDLGVTGQGAFVFNTALGLNLREDQIRGTSVKLRMGLSFAQFFTGTTTLWRTQYFPHDTLVSSGTGDYTYIDSVSKSTYDIQHRHQRIGLDVAVLFV